MRVALLLVLSGCDFFFPLKDPAPIDPDGGGDAAGTCLPGSVRDDFNSGGGGPCGDGIPSPLTPGTNIGRALNHLELRPARFQAGASDVACLWNDVPIIEGVFAEVVFPLDGEFTYTQVALNDGQLAVGIKVVRLTSEQTIYMFQANTLDGSNEAMLSQQEPYIPADMRWWRVRGVGASIVTEISVNQFDWKMFATAPSPLNGGTQQVSIGAGQFADGTGPGVAIVDNFNSCP